MKIALFNFMLVSSSLLAVPIPEVTEGQCHLESMETFTLKNIDPGTHFGVFAQGFSSRGDFIRLNIHHGDAYQIEIMSHDHHSTLVRIPKEASKTVIRVSSGSSTTKKEIVCHLGIVER